VNLATFVDRDTLVYERVYAHPIERVWEAVSTGEHLSTWLMPRITVERRAGGVATFTWGGTADDEPFETYLVSEWSPPSRITFADEATPAFMRFELTPESSGSETRLQFTLHWPAPDDAPRPWLPEALSTFHQTLDRLRSWLADAPLDELDSSRLIEAYEQLVAGR
jgi:uncharacterized protein YndB with AHSA1/START domain